MHEPARPDPLALHDAERDAHDRCRERRDDHRPDHRGRGVGQHAGRRDDRPRARASSRTPTAWPGCRPTRRSRSSVSSSRVRRWFSGRTRSRRPMFMAPSMPLAARGRSRRSRLASRRSGHAGPRTRYRRAGGRHGGPAPHGSAPSPSRSPSLALAGCSTSRPARRRPSPRPHRPPPPSPAPSPPTPSAPASAVPTARRSVPAGFSLDEVSSPTFPDLGGDLGAIGVVRVGAAPRLRPGGLAVPGHRAARVPGALRRPAHRRRQRRPRRRAPATPSSRSWSARSASPPADAPPTGNASAASLAGTVVARGPAGLRRLRGRRTVLRRGARPRAAVPGHRAREPDPARRRRLLGLRPLAAPGQRRSSSRCQDWVR